MAVFTTINNDYSKLILPLQTSGYFTNVYYDEESETLTCQRSDTTLSISKLSNNTCSVEFTISGTVKTWTLYWGTSSTTSILGGIYICSGGIYMFGTDDTVYSRALGYLIISETNNGKLGIIIPTLFTSRNGSAPFALASDDDVDYVTASPTAAKFLLTNMYNPPSNPTLNKPITQSVICEVPTIPPIGAPVSYFSDVFAEVITPMSFYNNMETQPINCLMDNRKYLWVGGFVICDEGD